jgi:hypothetical protein
MRSLLLRSMFASALFVGACTAGNSTPATAPETIAPAATTTAATTTTSTTLAPTTVPPAPATTVDRKAEIEAIFQDLEQRRLTALYEGDREAFAALFANDGYLQRSLEAFDLAEFESSPVVHVAVLDVVVDRQSCIAVKRQLTRVDSKEIATPIVGVLEPTETGWGLSFVGEGWTCDGSHPLEQ